jgi:hypothetical protein
VRPVKGITVETVLEVDDVTVGKDVVEMHGIVGYSAGLDRPILPSASPCHPAG